MIFSAQAADSSGPASYDLIHEVERILGVEYPRPSVPRVQSPTLSDGDQVILLLYCDDVIGGKIPRDRGGHNLMDAIRAIWKRGNEVGRNAAAERVESWFARALLPKEGMIPLLSHDQELNLHLVLREVSEGEWTIRHADAFDAILSVMVKAWGEGHKENVRRLLIEHFTEGEDRTLSKRFARELETLKHKNSDGSRSAAMELIFIQYMAARINEARNRETWTQHSLPKVDKKPVNDAIEAAIAGVNLFERSDVAQSEITNGIDLADLRGKLFGSLYNLDGSPNTAMIGTRPRYTDLMKLVDPVGDRPSYGYATRETSLPAREVFPVLPDPDRPWSAARERALDMVATFEKSELLPSENIQELRRLAESIHDSDPRAARAFNDAMMRALAVQGGPPHDPTDSRFRSFASRRPTDGAEPQADPSASAKRGPIGRLIDRLRDGFRPKK